MILVTVGVHTMPFDRLLKAVDAVAATGSLNRHELVVQHGASADICKAGRRFAYCSGSELDELLDRADLVITHGGIGTVLPALRRRKHVIAIPRLSKYGEHYNDHQIEVCAELADFPPALRPARDPRWRQTGSPPGRARPRPPWLGGLPHRDRRARAR